MFAPVKVENAVECINGGRALGDALVKGLSCFEVRDCTSARWAQRSDRYRCQESSGDSPFTSLAVVGSDAQCLNLVLNAHPKWRNPHPCSSLTVN